MFKIERADRSKSKVCIALAEGVGIGQSFLTSIADMYKQQGFRISIVTSSPSFVFGMQKNKNWVMTRKPGRLRDTARSGVLANTTSDERLTATFEYRK